MTRNVNDTADTTTIYVSVSALTRGELVEVELDQSALAEGRLVPAAHYGENPPLVLALNGRPNDKQSWEDTIVFAEFFLAEHAS